MVHGAVLITLILLPLIIALMMFVSFWLGGRLVDLKQTNPAKAQKWLTALALSVASARLLYQVHITRVTRQNSRPALHWKISGPIPVYMPGPQDSFKGLRRGQVEVKISIASSGEVTGSVLESATDSQTSQAISRIVN